MITKSKILRDLMGLFLLEYMHGCLANLACSEKERTLEF